MEAFSQLVSAVGLPIAEIVMIAVALWRVLLWIAPRADRVFTAHCELVAELKESVTKLREDVQAIKLERCRYTPPCPATRD